MSTLRAVINRESKIAVFSGPGTFAAKDDIKKLGPARWRSTDKSWEVRHFELSAEELSLKFPAIVIEDGSLDGKPSEAPLVTTPAESKALPSSRSISELLGDINRALSSAFSLPIYVRGVITSVKSAAPGRVFLTLADPIKRDDYIDCVIWSNVDQVCANLFRAGFQLESDLEVMFEVVVQLRQKGARVSLTITGVVAEYTISKLAAMREVTNEHLRKEGIFEQNKSCELPFLPRRLGILTSASGTVINDFCASLADAQFGFELFWLHVSVQGKDAKSQIVSGLRRLAAIEHLDAIVLIRGGGSASDLAVFNDYDVAKAVCLTRLPVLTAVGHQADQSSAQDVSFRSFGVPKDVGRFFAEIVLRHREQLSSWAGIIAQLVRPLVNHSETVTKKLQASIYAFSTTLLIHRSERLAGATSVLLSSGYSAIEREMVRMGSLVRHAFHLVDVHLGRAQERTARFTHTVSMLVERSLAEGKHQLLRLGAICRISERLMLESNSCLEGFSAVVAAADPQTQLRRGFSLVRKAGGGEYIGNGESLCSGDLVQIEFHDTAKDAKIQ